MSAKVFHMLLRGKRVCFAKEFRPRKAKVKKVHVTSKDLLQRQLNTYRAAMSRDQKRYMYESYDLQKKDEILEVFDSSIKLIHDAQEICELSKIEYDFTPYLLRLTLLKDIPVRWFVVLTNPIVQYSYNYHMYGIQVEDAMRERLKQCKQITVLVREVLADITDMIQSNDLSRELNRDLMGDDVNLLFPDLPDDNTLYTTWEHNVPVL